MKQKFLLILLAFAMLIPMLASCQQADPLTVKSIRINDAGNIILLMSDGTEIDAGKAPVHQSTSDPEWAKIDKNGDLIVGFSNGTKENLGNFDKKRTENYAPEYGMDGYVYKAYVRSETVGNSAYSCEDFYVDPVHAGADVISAEVVARNVEIETRYGCVIEQHPAQGASQFDEMSAFFDANVTFELAILLATDAAICATAGLLDDLSSQSNKKYLDLDAGWFDYQAVHQLNVGTRLYYVSGDMNISPLDNTMGIVFNQDMFDEHQLAIAEKLDTDMYSNLFDLAQIKCWTLEDMLLIANTVTVDAKSDDGVLSYEKSDTIGYYQHQSAPLYYYYASGMRITENVGDGLRFTVKSEEAQSVYEFLYNSLNTQKNPKIPKGSSDTLRENFLSGRVLFSEMTLREMREQLIDAKETFRYGLLPLPTYEPNQEYRHVVHFEDRVHLWALPTRREDAEFSAHLMNAMAQKSNNLMYNAYLQPLYSDILLENESKASLDIICGSLVYDTALLYTYHELWGNFDNMLTTLDTHPVMEYEFYTSDDAMKKADEELQDTLSKLLPKSASDE